MKVLERWERNMRIGIVIILIAVVATGAIAIIVDMAGAIND